MADIRQTPEWADYIRQIGWTVVGPPYAYLRRIPLSPFSVLKIQRVTSLPLDWLRSLQKEHHVITTYIEPLEPLTLPGYKPTWSAMLPTKTRVIDLTLPEDQLLTQLKSKTRYNLKQAHRHGISPRIVTSPHRFDDFYRLITANARRIGLWGISRKRLHALLRSFGDKAFIVMADDLAAALFLTAGTTAYYEENGSTAEGRRLFAPTAVVWAGLQEARRRGLTCFDFDGVSDDRYPTKRWAGFTRFKEGFGGQEVYFPQPLTQTRWPF